MLGRSIGVAQDPDNLAPIEKGPGERHGLDGGDVESSGHGTQGVPSRECRTEQGDWHSPGVGTCGGVGWDIVVDLPVIERNALLSREDSENGPGLLGSWQDE